jgi:cytochrome c551/c552
MPHFQLSSAEAASLSAFIISKAPVEPSPVSPAGDPDHGRKLFESKRCGACHETTETPRRSDIQLPRIPVHDFRRACLAPPQADHGAAPNFSLTDAERGAIELFLVSDIEFAAVTPPAEAAERLIRQFNCGACHSRDSDTSPRQLLTVEEGSGIVPDAIPQLTWTGEKLRSDWLAKFLAGERHAPLRPWLKARMPAFPAVANVLADGLRAQHGIAAEPEPPFAPDPELAAIGAKLAAPTALDCRQCHGFGPEEPRGDKQTLIALGLNFSDSRQRLRRDYYERFVRNPPRCDPGLRMPILALDGKTTKVTTIFGGDATKQFDALWHYLQSAPPRTNASQ